MKREEAARRQVVRMRKVELEQAALRARFLLHCRYCCAICGEGIACRRGLRLMPVRELDRRSQRAGEYDLADRVQKRQYWTEWLEELAEAVASQTGRGAA